MPKQIPLPMSMDTMRAAYDQVYLYTMGRPGFILQHVVDAFAVQTASESTKPIAVVFGDDTGDLVENAGTGFGVDQESKFVHVHLELSSQL